MVVPTLSTPKRVKTLKAAYMPGTIGENVFQKPRSLLIQIFSSLWQLLHLWKTANAAISPLSSFEWSECPGEVLAKQEELPRLGVSAESCAMVTLQINVEDLRCASCTSSIPFASSVGFSSIRCKVLDMSSIQLSWFFKASCRSGTLGPRLVYWTWDTKSYLVRWFLGYSD